jgi:hypothetical protein
VTRYSHLPRLLAGLLMAVAFAPLSHAAICGDGYDNPVVRENCGSDPSGWSTRWQVDRGTFVYDPGVLAGYVSSQSVNRGEKLNFYVQSPQQPAGFSIDIYRLGWYEGAGGRLLLSAPNLNSPTQPSCRWQNGRTVNGYYTCNNWHVSYSLAVPASWVSGVYVASIRSVAVPPGTGADARTAYAHDVVFVVRDDTRHADFIYQQPVSTEEAYNSAYGPSLYDTQSINGHTVPVAKVTFERPFDALDNLQFYRFELPFIFWLESHGYDVAYTTDIDTQERSTPFAGQYKAFILSGHSEYWTRPMYDAVEAARDAGVHLGFFGGDAVYWQMRLEEETAPPGDGSHSTRDRIMVVFRQPYPPDANGRGDPNPDPALQTTYWRDFPLVRDEEALVGVHFTHPLRCSEHVAGWAGPGTATAGPVLFSSPQPFVVADTSSWVFEGTGLQVGDSIAHVYGQESDAFEPIAGSRRCGRAAADPPAHPPSYRTGTFSVIAASPFEHVVNRPPAPATRTRSVVPVNSVIYQACSGAWVFGAGDIMWGNTLATSFLLNQDYSSPQLQRMSGNILDVFAGRKSAPGGGACVVSFPLVQNVLELVLDN